mgnify:CR=1 FL=1
MQPAPAIPLEKLAAIDAQLEAGKPRDRVFADAGVTSEVWERAKDAWFARMASEAVGGKGRKLHKRYHDLLQAERKATGTAKRQTPKKLEGKAPKAPAARLSPLAAQYRPDAPRVSSRPEAAESPSGVFRAPVAPPPVVAPVREPSTSGEVLVNALPFGGAAQPLPFVPSAAPNPSAPTNLPGQAKPLRASKETVAFDMRVDEEQTLLHKGGAKAALPFVQTKPAPASFDETSEPVRSPLRKDPLPFVQTKQRSAAIDETSVTPGKASRDVLPFVAAQRSAAPSAPPPAHRPSAPPPPAFGADPLEQTRFDVVAPRADALPFSGGSTSSPQPTNPSKAKGLPFQQAPSPPAQASPSTPPPPNPQSGLPFQKSAPPAGAGARPASQAPPPNQAEPIDLTRYACLCAELARYPEESERIFTRYGLAEPRLRASVDATWRSRLSQDPQLYRTWQEYYQHYFTQWFGQGRKM